LEDGGAVKKVLIASIAPDIVVAVRGIIIAGGNGPVKGIRIAGVVIEDATSLSWRKSGGSPTIA
jgi:hypothetical protein